MLMEHSFQEALALSYDAVVIFGSPVNYVSSGFKSCKNTTSVWKIINSPQR